MHPSFLTEKGLAFFQQQQNSRLDRGFNPHMYLAGQGEVLANHGDGANVVYHDNRGIQVNQELCHAPHRWGRCRHKRHG
jgi:hypothetical protein